MFRPRDKDIRRLFDEFYGSEDNDRFSKQSDRLSMMRAASRLNRGSIIMQNGVFIDDEFMEIMRDYISVKFIDRGKKKK